MTERTFLMVVNELLHSNSDSPGKVLTPTDSPYGFQRHVTEYGSGVNLLRTDRLAQPSALKIGDILATGEKILSKPRGGYNGIIYIHLSGGTDWTWIKVASRLPLALLTPEDNAPVELWAAHDKEKLQSNS